MLKSGNNLSNSIYSLSSPLGTFNYDFYEFENYPTLKALFNKISNCGRTVLEFLNIKTGEKLEIPAYCDNRVCKNPECQRHRLIKYMRKHYHQIKDINEDMRKPKAWIFSTPRKHYPIDRKFCQDNLKKLYFLLLKYKHRKYGSNSKFSVHMEIKPDSNSWYLHFHVTSGGITNLRLVRKLWGYQISYEKAINPKSLARYVSKYASKTPKFPNKIAFFEYANAVYKLQMHRFSTKIKLELRQSDWVLIGIKKGNGIYTFGEMIEFFDDYINDFGYGG